MQCVVIDPNQSLSLMLMLLLRLLLKH